jgi:myosin heavy subunit
MSSLGKIFIVLNLVLAGAFFGWAYNAYNTNAEFKAKYEQETSAHAASKKALEADVDKLKAEGRDLTTAKNRLQEERDEARRMAERNKADYDGEAQKNSQLRVSVDKIAATLGEMEAGKSKLQGERDKAIAAQRDAEDKARSATEAQMAAEKDAADKNAALEAANSSISDMEKAARTASQDISRLEAQLATLVANTGARVSDFASMQDIKGAVLDVTTSIEPGLVSINKGATDGVKRGYTFEIYDGKVYKGQARVEFVHDTMCSAILIRTVPGQSIRQGDGAATRL